MGHKDPTCMRLVSSRVRNCVPHSSRSTSLHSTRACLGNESPACTSVLAARRLKAGLAALQQHQRTTDRVCRALALRCPGSTELQHMYHDSTRGFTPVADALAVSPELLVQQPALPEAAAAPLLDPQAAGTTPPLTDADRPAEVDAEDWAHLVQLRDLRLTVQREAASASLQGKALQQQIDKALLVEQQMLGQIQLQKEVGNTAASTSGTQHH